MIGINSTNEELKDFIENRMFHINFLKDLPDFGGMYKEGRQREIKSCQDEIAQARYYITLKTNNNWQK